MSGRPELSYVVCTLPRSGSYLLCDGLAETGRLGYPAEYYSQLQNSYFRDLVGPDKFDDYNVVFDHAMRVGTTPNGVFAAKVLYHHLETLKRRFDQCGHYGELSAIEILDHLLPRPHYLHLRRADRLRQAISYYRASKSGIWFRFEDRTHTDEREDVAFDFDEIHHWVNAMEQWDQAWPRLLEQVDGPVMTLDYEEVVGDYTGALRRVHSFVGITPSPDFELIKPAHRRQSDATTEAWIGLYRECEAEAATLGARTCGRAMDLAEQR